MLQSLPLTPLNERQRIAFPFLIERPRKDGDEQAIAVGAAAVLDNLRPPFEGKLGHHKNFTPGNGWTVSSERRAIRVD
jgi:hypothetical protein